MVCGAGSVRGVVVCGTALEQDSVSVSPCVSLCDELASASPLFDGVSVSCVGVAADVVDRRIA